MTNFFNEKWAAREINLLSELYPTESMERISQKIPRHTPGAIYQKAFVLGIKKQKKTREREGE